MSTSTAPITGYKTGTWTIDPTHSEVGFSIRHMMVSKVRGKFTNFTGEFVTGDSPLGSTVTATVELSSIDTGNADRDAHVRGADFFDVEAHREMTFRSTGVRTSGDDFVLDGELTLKGITKPLSLELELGGFGPDAFGGYRAGFTATGEIKRSDFDVSFNPTMETGGVVLGDKVQIQLEIEGVLQG